MSIPVAPLPRVRSQQRGTVLILVASFFFGSSGVIGKPAMLAGLSPEQVAAARIGLAAVILFALVGLIRPRSLRVRRGDWPLLLGYGLLGVAGAQLCYFIAAGRIPVGIAILLEFTSPVLVALWVRFARRTKLPVPMWGGIALAMAGLVLVAQVWEGDGVDLLGLLAGLGAAVCAMAYFLLSERAGDDRDPIGLVTWGMAIGGAGVCVVAPPWTLPAAVLTTPASFGPWHPPVWALLVAVALLSTALAYLLGTTALRHLPASVGSVLALMEPVVATVLAWVLLGEQLTWIQVAGAAVLLTGAVIVQLNPPRGEPVTR